MQVDVIRHDTFLDKRKEMRDEFKESIQKSLYHPLNV